MKKIAVIPARFAATRFPGKLMEKIGGKTIIRMVYENAVSTQLFDRVLVVTDSEVIFNEIKTNGGEAAMSKREHQSGSDRIAEAIEQLDVDVIINIQGDEPFIKKEPLQHLLECFNDPSVQVASLMKKFDPQEEVGNPNWVKVVFNLKKDALYFSRSIIPFKRNLSSPKAIYKHIGVYGFRKNTLLSFTKWPLGELEQTEMLEQLRYLENGVNIRMVETTETSLGIDTPEDLEAAKKFYQSTLFNSHESTL
ncbi:MAG: 3-deoxy-manno-octulosonate cytidylyltransferase [Bacteroidota bacterium]|jgi:3-deoxy-manno-octulosonate cytidylyltransferase (CMP-KDO synthetase)